MFACRQSTQLTCRQCVGEYDKEVDTVRLNFDKENMKPVPEKPALQDKTQAAVECQAQSIQKVVQEQNHLCCDYEDADDQRECLEEAERQRGELEECRREEEAERVMWFEARRRECDERQRLEEARRRAVERRREEADHRCEADSNQDSPEFGARLEEKQDSSSEFWLKTHKVQELRQQCRDEEEEAELARIKVHHASETIKRKDLNSFLASSGFKNVNDKKIEKGFLTSSFCYPLHAAVRANNVDAVKLLLWGGARNELTDSKKLTPSALALRLNRNGSHSNVVALLRN